MPALQAKVKSVLSGDTVLLSNPKGAERTLSLAYISAPRLKREGDEPFAYQSREFLRDQLVGKVVAFETLYTVPTTKREYGKVTLPNGASFPERVVGDGWAKLREDAGRKDDSPEAVALLEKLKELETSAKHADVGVWGSDGRIEASYEVTDPAALVEIWKGKQLEAIVEKVLTGDRLIARLLISPQKHIQTMLVLAGIRAPSTKRTSPEGNNVPAEPYGTEAHQYVEERLTQRKCIIQLVGVTPQNQLIGSVIHPKGNIAKFLLDDGLARCNDQHVTLLGKDMAAFRQAERAAKDARKGIFSGQTPAKPSGPVDEQIVVRVMNADTIIIRSRTGTEKKVNLSSVRQPKPSDPKQSPFNAEAKEALRRKIIGKHVKVSIDGKKAANEGYEERDVATVTLNGKNIALAMVEAGWVSVIRHRKDDDDRSSDYDSLLLAEETAQKEEKGMWSSKPPAAKHYQDYSESLQKAKMEASVLMRQKRVPCIVDFVKSAARFVVLVPRENAKFTFVLSGIRAPRSARNPGEKSEPFGHEAHDLANRRCMQRDGEIDVESLDKVGGFIGTLFINRENFAKVLVDEGYAEVHTYSAETSLHGPELIAAEKRAKEARKGRWKDWDPTADNSTSNDYSSTPALTSTTNGSSTTPSAAATPKEPEYRDVVITHIDPSTGHLKLQQIGSGTTALTTLMSSFRTFHLSPPSSTTSTTQSKPPKVGDLVSAQFSLDKSWYRARVRRVDRTAQTVEVVYIDYGNAETVPWKELRGLEGEKFGLGKLKAQAVEAGLSLVGLSNAEGYRAEALGWLSESVEGREGRVRVDFVDGGDGKGGGGGGVLWVTLFVGGKGESEKRGVEESVNADLIREGLGMVPRKLKGWERGKTADLENLKKAEETAKEERKGMWEYGDLTED